MEMFLLFEVCDPSNHSQDNLIQAERRIYGSVN